MAREKTNQTPVVSGGPYFASIILTLLLTVPPIWALVQHERNRLPWRESNLWIVVIVMAFVVSPLVVGAFAALRRTRHSLRTAAISVASGSITVIALAMARKLIDNHRFVSTDFSAYAIYFLFTVAVGICSGYVAVRRVIRRGP